MSEISEMSGGVCVCVGRVGLPRRKNNIIAAQSFGQFKQDNLSVSAIAN